MCRKEVKSFMATYRNIYTTTIASKPWKAIWIDGIKTKYEIHKTKGVRNAETHQKIKPYENSGYMVYPLHLNGKSECVHEHRLYACIFMPLPEELKDIPKTSLVINHKDGNGRNNDPSNIEWCTQRKMYFMLGKLVLIHIMGKNCHLAKISNDKAKEICELLQEGGRTITEVSKIAKVDPRIVRSIYQHDAWNFLSKDYDFSKVKMQNVDEEKVYRACELLEVNRYSDREIGEMCGLTRKYVNDLRNKKTRLDISRYFTFDSSIPESKDAKRARSICIDLEAGKLSVPEIAAKYDVTPQNVYDIRNGRTWGDISKRYSIKKPKSKMLTEEKICEICEKLEIGGISDKKLAVQLGVSRDTVMSIRLKRSHTDISKDYNF